MYNVEQVDEILSELNRDNNIITSFVILKSGTLVAGCLPEEVDLETFIAMASILISAAESVTSDFKGKLENVFVNLDGVRIIIESSGKKGALVVMTNTKDNNGHINAQIKKAALGLGAVL